MAGKTIKKGNTMNMQKIGNIVAATVIGGSGLFVSENFWTKMSSSSFLTQAEARYGVARRSYRRAAVASAVIGGALAAGYGYGYGYGTGYPSYSYASGYPSYGYGNSYPSYSYGYGYPSYASYGYYRPWGLRGWWW
jgi:hypothetical protein